MRKILYILLPTAFCACGLLFASRSYAQQADNPVYYLLGFQATVDNRLGGTTYGGGFSVSIVDETGQQLYSSLGGAGVNSSGTRQTAKLLPNKNYTLSVSGSMFVYASFVLQLTNGNSTFLYVDGSNERSQLWTQNYTGPQYQNHVGYGPGITEVHTISISMPGSYPLEGAPSNLRGGESSPIVPDKPIWYIGLGNTRKGYPAGTIGFRAQDFSGATGGDSFFTPAQLIYDPLDDGTNEISGATINGVTRQVFSREILADIQAVTSTSYKIDIYARKQVNGQSGGLYTIDSSDPSPFITYTVAKTATGGVKITRTEDGIVWETSLEYNNFTWTRRDWAVQGTATVSTLTTAYSSTTAASITQSGPGSSVGGDTPLSWNKTFSTYSWGNELSTTTFGANEKVPMTSSWVYYDTYGGTGWGQSLKSSIDPSGSWTKYEYNNAYPFGDNYGLNGTIKRSYRPWLDGPTSPDSATTANSVYTDYTYEMNGGTWPTSQITYAPDGQGGSVAIAKTVWTYDFTTTGPQTSHAMVTTTRSDYANSGDILQTVAKTIRPDDATYPDRAISTRNPNGTMDSYAYFTGTWDPSTLTFTASDAGNDRLTVCLHGQSSAHAQGDTVLPAWTVSGTGANSWPLDPVHMVANLSTATQSVIDTTGRLVFTGEYVYVSSNTLAIVSGTSYKFDGHGRLTEEDDAVRSWMKTTHEYSASVAGRYPVSVKTTTASGVVTRYDYDTLMRLAQTTEGDSGDPMHPSKVHPTDLDAANRPVAGYSCSCGTSPVRYYYDTAGRMIKKLEISPNDAAGTTGGSLKTTYDYSVAQQLTTTSPNGATRVETTYLDGHPKSVTGTGQAPIYYSYAANSAGLLTSTYKATSADMANGWAQNQADWLGRATQHSEPTYGWNSANSNVVCVSNTYSPGTGTLSRQRTTSGTASGSLLTPDHLYVYDEAGRLTAEGLDIDADGVLGGTAGTSSKNDRIMTHSGVFSNLASGWWSVTTTGTYAIYNSNTVTKISEVDTQLTGFPVNTVAKTVSIDASGRASTRTDSVDASNKLATTTISIDGLSNVSYQSTKNGYDYEGQAFSGERTQRLYDSLGRLQYVKSRWDGSAFTATDTFTYDTANPDTNYVHTATVGGVTTTYTYGWPSGGGRIVSSQNIVDGLPANAAYTYYNLMDLPQRIGGAGTSATAIGYDSLGRRTSLTTYPSGPFDETNWPTTGGNAIQWTPDPATGLVTQKRFADGTHVDYTYTALGQPSTRRWARLGSDLMTGVLTTFTYYDSINSGSDKSAVSYRTQELMSVAYSNDPANTPSVTYTYTRAGLPAGVNERITGSCIFGYDTTNPLRLKTETLGSFYNAGGASGTTRQREFEYDDYGRGIGFKLGSATTPDADLAQTFDYTTDSGLLVNVYSSVAGGSKTVFTYAYKSTHSSLVDHYSVGSFKASYDYDTSSAARLATVSSTWGGGAAITEFDLAYNARGQLQAAVQKGSAFTDYYTGMSYNSMYNYHAYDAMGQLQTTVMYRNTPPISGAPGSGDELPGRRFEYRYDNTGNRVSSGPTGSTGANGPDDAYVLKANGLNQYDTKENNTLRILGTASAAANVAAQATGGATPLFVNKKDRNFAADVVPLNNASGPANGIVTIYAAVPGINGGTDTVDTQQRFWQMPQQKQSFVYDADGNLLSDGVWSYAYDAENRLKQMKSLLPKNQGFKRLQLDFAYDYIGRRVQKTVTDPDTNAIISTSRFLYDGWNLVAEMDDSAAIKRSYTWGLDISGTGATAGIGALLQIADTDNSKTYYPTYDGNGNVSALVDLLDGSVAALYEYSPYGEPLRSQVNASITGNALAYLVTQPFRYSTRFVDSESGLIYYGMRYYSPTLGRFINRDPIEEAGGVNLYAFGTNAPNHHVDVLGTATGVYYSCSYRDHWALIGGTIVITQTDFLGCTAINLDANANIISPSFMDIYGYITAATNKSAPNKPWEPNKTDCDALRSQYSDLFKEGSEKFDSPLTAFLAAEIDAGAFGVTAQAEVTNLVFKRGNGSYGYVYGGASDPGSPGEAGVNYGNAPEGSSVIAVAHNHNVGVTSYVAAMQRAFWNADLANAAAQYPILGELFSYNDMRIPFSGPTPTTIGVFTPSGDIRAYSNRVYGPPSNSKDTSSGYRVPGAPSKDDALKIAACKAAHL